MRRSGVISGSTAIRFVPETSGHNAEFENALRQLLFSLYCYYTRTRFQRALCIYMFISSSTKRHSFFPLPQRKHCAKSFKLVLSSLYDSQFVARTAYIPLKIYVLIIFYSRYVNACERLKYNFKQLNNIKLVDKIRSFF